MSTETKRGGPGRGQGRKPLKQGEETVTLSLLLPIERECCGTFPGAPHRATCAKYRGKFKSYNALR